VPDVSVREARVFDKTIFEDAPSTEQERGTSNNTARLCCSRLGKR
jgi:hypothetical protein